MEDDLREAAACGDREKVLELLNERPSIVNSQHKLNGWTPLHWAAKRNQAVIVDLLLDHGADLSIETDDKKGAHQLTTDHAIIKKLTGKEIASSDVQLTESNKESAFKPSYLTYSGLPSYYKPKSNESPNNVPQQATNNASITSSNRDFQHLALSNGSETGVVLKLRIGNLADKDFIEVDLPADKYTFKDMMELFCSELGIEQMCIWRVRKLPNTILRNDSDVRRLTDYQEIELILDRKVQTSNFEVLKNNSETPAGSSVGDFASQGTGIQEDILY